MLFVVVLPTGLPLIPPDLGGFRNQPFQQIRFLFSIMQHSLYYNMLEKNRCWLEAEGVKVVGAEL
jgi:hypothetical protein